MRVYTVFSCLAVMFCASSMITTLPAMFVPRRKLMLLADIHALPFLMLLISASSCTHRSGGNPSVSHASYYGIMYAISFSVWLPGLKPMMSS